MSGFKDKNWCAVIFLLGSFNFINMNTNFTFPCFKGPQLFAEGFKVSVSIILIYSYAIIILRRQLDQKIVQR